MLSDIYDITDLKCYEEFKRVFPKSSRKKPQQLDNCTPHECDLDVEHQLQHSLFSNARIFDPHYTPVQPDNPDYVNLSGIPFKTDGIRSDRSTVYKGILFTNHAVEQSRYRDMSLGDCVDIINNGCLIEVNYRWEPRKGLYHVNIMASEKGMVVYDPIDNEVLTAYKLSSTWARNALNLRLKQKQNKIPVDVKQLKTPKGSTEIHGIEFQQALDTYGDKYNGRGRNRHIVHKAARGFEGGSIDLGRSSLTYYLGKQGQVNPSFDMIPGHKRLERQKRRQLGRALSKQLDADGFTTVVR